MIRYCVICGTPFAVSPSTNKTTCSPACRSARAANAARKSKRTWSDAARQRRRENPSIQAAMGQMQPSGTAAAHSLPEGQRGPQNRESKSWVLIDPNGNHVRLTNLLHWARNHYTLFEPECTDPEAAARRISSGIKAIACSMRGAPSRRRRVASYKGWGLASLPTSTEEDH